MSSKKRGWYRIPMFEDVESGLVVHKMIRYNPNSLVLLEESLGIKNVLTYLKDAKDNPPGIRDLRMFVWAGITGAGGEHSIEDVGEALVLTKIGDYWASIVKAMTVCMTGKEPKEAKSAAVCEEEEGGLVKKKPKKKTGAGTGGE